MNTINLTRQNIIIRRAQPEEAEIISKLLHDAFLEYRPLYTEKGFGATTPSSDDIADRIKKKAVWIVLADDKITGTVSIFPRGDELFIRSMAVSPVARSKGIGKKLMEHVNEMAFAAGCSTIALNTTPFLLNAIRLYENCGFKKMGMGDLHGTPLIKMIKDLKLSVKNKIENNDYAK